MLYCTYIIIYLNKAIGLETTTASRSAFLLYLNVKLVPIFAALLYKKSISINTWISAALVYF
jgi:drug/metabolite transporter (DMT)-like permease